MLRDEEDAPQVDGGHLVELVDRQHLRGPAPVCAGHVEHRVHTAELPQRGLEHRRHVGVLRHVAVDGKHAFPDLGSGVLLRAADVGGHHLGPFSHEDLRRRLRDPRTRTGDHRYFAVEDAHG